MSEMNVTCYLCERDKAICRHEYTMDDRETVVIYECGNHTFAEIREYAKKINTTK